MEKAPDKIYVAEAMETEKCLFGLWTDKDHRDTPYVEYIRKDALLEWAKNWEKIGVSEDFAYAIEKLIKHIESL